MIRYCLLIFCCFLAEISIGQTQLEINQEAKSEYQKSEKKLNVVYQNVLRKHKTDQIFLKNLKNAQRIWIQFRDAEMKAKYPDREEGYYGSIHPMCWFGYMKELTDERIANLKVWLEKKSEGDAC